MIKMMILVLLEAWDPLEPWRLTATIPNRSKPKWRSRLRHKKS